MTPGQMTMQVQVRTAKSVPPGVHKATVEAIEVKDNIVHVDTVLKMGVSKGGVRCQKCPYTKGKTDFGMRDVADLYDYDGADRNIIIVFQCPICGARTRYKIMHKEAVEILWGYVTEKWRESDGKLKEADVPADKETNNDFRSYERSS